MAALGGVQVGLANSFRLVPQLQVMVLAPCAVTSLDSSPCAPATMPRMPTRTPTPLNELRFIVLPRCLTTLTNYAAHLRVVST